jgi:hypothetical protein
VDRRLDLDALRFGCRSHRVDRVEDDWRDVHRAEVQPELARHDPRDVEELVDEPRLRCGVSRDRGESPVGLLGRQETPAQEVGPGEDRGEGVRSSCDSVARKSFLRPARGLRLAARFELGDEEAFALVVDSLAHGESWTSTMRWSITPRAPGRPCMSTAASIAVPSRRTSRTSCSRAAADPVSASSAWAASPSRSSSWARSNQRRCMSSSRE